MDMLTNQQEMIEVSKTIKWVQEQIKSKNVVWHNSGIPQVSGLYERSNPGSNEKYYCYFEKEWNSWLQGFSDLSIAKNKAVEWMLLSRDSKLKQINKQSSAWQKLPWKELE